ncbi:transcriptional regulator [Ampullimonas aquatilis]|uniref:transcriptional regulator n=1 Tax=Ampullimonas aquatilis TaxID=1341549 RepID=UPI003C78D57F
METLDPTLHQPLRTQIAAYLAGSGEATFSELKRELAVSDGNLDSHIKKLIAVDYVEVRKESSEESGIGRPQTVFMLTETGRNALQEYVAALQRMLSFGQGTAASSGGNNDKPGKGMFKLKPV